MNRYLNGSNPLGSAGMIVEMPNFIGDYRKILRGEYGEVLGAPMTLYGYLTLLSFYFFPRIHWLA
jgi:hypothetical protein